MHGSAAATDAVAGVPVPGAPLPVHENGNSPTTQLEDSYVFLSDGGSSKEEDLYGDGSPDAGAAAALQHSPAGACSSPVMPVKRLTHTMTGSRVQLDIVVPCRCVQLPSGCY